MNTIVLYNRIYYCFNFTSFTSLPVCVQIKCFTSLPVLSSKASQLIDCTPTQPYLDDAVLSRGAAAIENGLSCPLPSIQFPAVVAAGKLLMKWKSHFSTTSSSIGKIAAAVTHALAVQQGKKYNNLIKQTDDGYGQLFCLLNSSFIHSLLKA